MSRYMIVVVLVSESVGLHGIVRGAAQDAESTHVGAVRHANAAHVIGGSCCCTSTHCTVRISCPSSSYISWYTSESEVMMKKSRGTHVGRMSLLSPLKLNELASLYLSFKSLWMC